MNEKAVKQLTEKGCIVAKEAAEALSEEDIQQIEELESPPMYITEDMLSDLRDSFEDTEEKVSAEQVEKSETVHEKDDKEDSVSEESNQEDSKKKTGSKPLGFRDTGSRDDIRTKVEITDKANISKDEKDVPEFLNYYNDRYDKSKKILMRRREMRSAVSISRIDSRNEGEQAATIGLVKEKYSTSSGKWIVEIEDKTDTFKLLVDEREGERIVPDEVIGVKGSNGGDIIYVNSIVRPDLPIPDGLNTTEEKIKAAYISDLHIGSKDTLYDRMDKFANWLNSDQASKIGYLVIAGDAVEGIGVYPGQDKNLKYTNIYKQYQKFEEWIDKIPEDIQIIVSPGNHDIVRLAEPQPRLPDKVFDRVHKYNNVHLVQNPQKLRLHGIRSKGIKHLLYHGMSYDSHVDNIKDLREKAYDDPHHVMIDLLKRRHLAPTYGSNLMSPEGRDHLLIDEKPDVMVSGHFHSHANESYKGVNVICSSAFQGQTDFQKRMGHDPQPGLVTLMDFKTRNTEVKKF